MSWPMISESISVGLGFPTKNLFMLVIILQTVKTEWNRIIKKFQNTSPFIYIPHPSSLYESCF